MKRQLASLVVLIVCAGVLAAAGADATEVIAKARAYIGSEAALNALKSVRYTGTLELIEETSEGPKPLKLPIEIIFQKPLQQRVVVTGLAKVETTALDGYEAWQKQQDLADPSKWLMTIMPVPQIKNLRANARENLSFFRGIEAFGGRLEDQGAAEIEGVSCRKLAFVYSPEIVFTRYFDIESGKLMLTETEQGSRIREEGEIMSGGLRFPRKIVTTTRTSDGDDRVVTITFDTVTVNEVFPASDFQLPFMPAR